MREGSIAHRYSCVIIVNFTLDNSSVQLRNTQGFTLSYEERPQFSGCHSRLLQIRPMDPSFGLCPHSHTFSPLFPLLEVPSIHFGHSKSHLSLQAKGAEISLVVFSLTSQFWSCLQHSFQSILSPV